jgi:hypothetical protein
MGDGKGPDAPASGVKYRVGDGGGDAHQADLADAFDADGVEPVGLADEDHVHIGNVGVDRHQVVAEGGVGDAPGSGVGDGLLQQGMPAVGDGDVVERAAAQW